jgi:hypothetical protein
LFPDILVNFCLQFRWPQWLLVWQSISCSTFSEFLYLNFYTLISFQLPFILHSYLMVLLHQSISRFCPSCFWLLCQACIIIIIVVVIIIIIIRSFDSTDFF